MLLVAGRKTNLFAEAFSLAPSSQNLRLPASNVGNGDPALPGAAADATSPWDIILDGRLKSLTDPHFDSNWPDPGGAPIGWIKIGTNIVRDDIVKDPNPELPPEAGASVRFDRSDGEDLMRGLFEVACGAQLDISCSMRREAAALGTLVLVYCRNTGLFWDPASGWVASDVVVLNGVGVAADTWGTVSTTAPVQVPNLNDRDLASLEIWIRPQPYAGAPTAKNWADNLRVRPRASFLSIHHPRNTAGAVFDLDTSSDAVNWTNRASIPGASAAREAFASFSALSAVWWRLRVRMPSFEDFGLTYTPDFLGAPAIGEAVLALARQSVGTWRKVDDAWDVPQARVGQAGRYRQAQAGGPYRKVTLQRMGADAADWGLILNRLYLATLGGVRACVLAWDEDVPSRVVLGALDPGLQLPFDVTEPNVPHTLALTGFTPPIWTS